MIERKKCNDTIIYYILYIIVFLFYIFYTVKINNKFIKPYRIIDNDENDKNDDSNSYSLVKIDFIYYQ